VLSQPPSCIRKLSFARFYELLYLLVTFITATMSIYTCFVRVCTLKTVLLLVILLLSCAIAYCLDVLLTDDSALLNNWHSFYLLVAVKVTDISIVFACVKQLTVSVLYLSSC